MSDVIKYVVECETWYGVIALFIFLVWMYASAKIFIPQVCETIKFVARIITKYSSVHAKANVKDVSFETDLHR